MSNIQQQIKELQEKRINEIINDESLSKLQKLNLFEEEKLFKIEDYIQDEEIFKEWVDELTLLVKEEKGQNCCICDTFLSPSEIDAEKYTTLHLSEIDTYLECLIEDNDEEYDGMIFDYNKPLPIVTARGSKLTIDKTPQEVLDKVYDYAITNKVCGYKIDW